MFFEVFSNLCDKRNVPKSKVLSDIGLSTGNLDKWKKGASINSDVVIKIAEYFNVSTDFLLMGKDNELSLNDNELELLKLFRELKTEKQQDRFLGKMEMIIQEMIDQDMKKIAGS